MNLINATEFDSLTRSKKIVAIAKDVIKRISLDLIAPNTGEYFSNKFVYQTFGGIHISMLSVFQPFCFSSKYSCNSTFARSLHE